MGFRYAFSILDTSLKRLTKYVQLLYEKESSGIWRNWMVPQYYRRHGKTASYIGDILVFMHTQVEGEAQGDDDIMQKFFKDVGQGPGHAKVTKVVKEDRDVVEGDGTFEVRR